MSKLATELERIVRARVEADRLVLPALPMAAAACLELLKDPECSTKRLAAAVGRDPLLAAQIVRAANAAAFGGGPVATSEQALARLGLSRARTIIVQAAARAVFSSRNPKVAVLCAGVWEHSLAVALLARDLAALSGAENQEAAYLAGLLHDVGKPVVASYLLEAERQLGGSWDHAMGADQWLDVVARVHHPVAVAIAEKWRLPPAVAAAIRDCGEYDAGERRAPANFVRFANAVAVLEGLDVGSPDADEARAMIMIGRSVLDLDDEVVGRLSADLRGRVAALAA